jgi:hypothetical protein
LGDRVLGLLLGNSHNLVPQLCEFGHHRLPRGDGWRVPRVGVEVGCKRQ